MSKLCYGEHGCPKRKLISLYKNVGKPPQMQMHRISVYPSTIIWTWWIPHHRPTSSSQTDNFQSAKLRNIKLPLTSCFIYPHGVPSCLACKGIIPPNKGELFRERSCSILYTLLAICFDLRYLKRWYIMRLEYVRVDHRLFSKKQ